MHSDATTVEAYLAELPGDRQAAVARVRGTILENLQDGFEEAMNFGMICYQIPLADYPQTYNQQPLMYAALASQKNYMTVYLMGIYTAEDGGQEFEQRYRATGKRYDVGKSCVRFKRLEDLPLDLIGQAIAADSPETWIAKYEASRHA